MNAVQELKVLFSNDEIISFDIEKQTEYLYKNLFYSQNITKDNNEYETIESAFIGGMNKLKNYANIHNINIIRINNTLNCELIDSSIQKELLEKLAINTKVTVNEPIKTSN